MALTINITYTGAPGAARAFADEMVAAGVVDERPLCQSRRQLRAEAAAYVDTFRKKLEAGM